MGNQRFSIIPSRAVTDKEMPPAVFRTLAALGMFGDRNGWCYPSLSTIAKMLGYKSKATVSKHIRWLAEHGYLNVAKRFDENGGQTSNLYQIRFDFPPQDEEQQTEQSQAKDTPVSTVEPPRFPLRDEPPVSTVETPRFPLRGEPPVSPKEETINAPLNTPSNRVKPPTAADTPPASRKVEEGKTASEESPSAIKDDQGNTNLSRPARGAPDDEELGLAPGGGAEAYKARLLSAMAEGARRAAADAERGFDPGDWPEPVRHLARAFVLAVRAPVDAKERRFWAAELSKWLPHGVTPQDVAAAARELRDKGLTIGSPRSLRNVVLDLAARRRQAARRDGARRRIRT